MGILGTVLEYVLPILTALPSLITGVESLWKATPKSGPQKWISVEQAVSGTIEAAAQTIAKAAPAGTDAQTISDAIAIFTKSVNDAFVALMNALKILPTTPAS